MKRGLHAWDDLDNQINAQLEAVEQVLAKPQIDPEQVEQFRQEREKLWKLTAKERAENIENAEAGKKWAIRIALGALAAEGGLLALKLGAAAALLKGGTALLSRAKPIAEAGSAFVRQAMGHPVQTSRSLLQSAEKFGRWIQGRWYRRWAPVPLLMGAGLARTYWASKKLEQAMTERRVQPPKELAQKIKYNVPTWEEGIKILQEYSHQKEWVEELLPKMFARVVTPEGALVLSHILLETFSLSPVLDPAAKNEYGPVIEDQFKQAVRRYGRWVLTLNLTGATSSRERVYEIQEGNQTTYIRGYVVEPGIKDLIEEMRGEKEALLALMDLHEAWVDYRLRSENPERHEAYLQVIRSRKGYVQKAYSLHWNEVQSKLNNLDQYLAKIQESFASMGIDFQMKNRDIWMHYVEHASLANLITNPSAGQFAGWWGGTLFVRGSGFFSFLKAIPFGLAAGFVTSSYTAEELAGHYSPVRMCLPSYGALCEQL
ncbi:MAG: hypothetical protein HY609_02780 [Deltaproteobacteria bacterium]|nr:hypothetical protein [Deltaproteobacteria bacterium]MBI4223834.1 hypothetical protein [Deltaproteobacteria bacterium]